MTVEDWAATMQKRGRPLAKSGMLGPKPERLKIQGDWREPVKKSLTMKKPHENWPKQATAHLM